MFSNYDLHKLIKNPQAFQLEIQSQQAEPPDPSEHEKLERMKAYKLMCQLRELRRK